MRKLMTIFAFSCCFLLNSAFADEMNPGAMAHFYNPQGDMIGEAKLWAGRKGVVIKVDISGLEPGKHAIHIHSVGTCEPDFKASKGHIKVNKTQHGLLNPDGPDNGDLPNIYAHSDGSVMAEMYSAAVYLEGMMQGNDHAGNLMDQDGSALVVHAMGDDHVTQPIGGAGGRVACGVITGMM